jgi:hypothetical protein
MKRKRNFLKNILKTDNKILKAKTINRFSSKAHRECYNGHRKVEDKRIDNNL